MRTIKKLIIGLAVLAASVTGMQADECDVCRRDPLGLSDECRDVRLDYELRLNLSIRHERDDLAVAPGIDRDTLPLGKRYIRLIHDGARLQWSTNSVDWKFFNHSRGVGIQPDLSRWTFSHGLGFPIGQPVDLHLIGNINWGAGIYEGPEITKFFVRLLPCDVNAHLQAYKNMKIEIEKQTLPLAKIHSRNNHFRAEGIRVKVSWNYGVLESTKSLRFPDWGPPKSVGAGAGYFSRVQSPWNLDVSTEIVDGQWAKVTNGVVNKLFYRIKPLNQDALKTFQIDLDDGKFGEVTVVSDIPTVTIENNRKAQ